MKVEIRTDGFDAGPELHRLARCCAGYELGPFRQQVERVRVRLSAAPQPGRGRDIGCAVQVDFFDSDSLSTAAADASPYVAIHWALERAGEAIARQLQAEPCSEIVAAGPPSAGNLQGDGGVADRAA